ncbi:hypothetical protein KCP77_21085 [Salmonella enterica subsp. enterica]|nr:hypothetical protein KCP77_21085 [Salmonella enterica subsp. enterica]
MVRFFDPRRAALRPVSGDAIAFRQLTPPAIAHSRGRRAFQCETVSLLNSLILTVTVFCSPP